MKKKFGTFVACLLAGLMTLCSLTIPSFAAEEESTESYHAFIAIGADGANAGSWGLQYYGEGSESNAGAATAVEGELKNGETLTLSVEFAEEVTYTWFTAPCFVVEDPTTISANSTFEVKVLLDGKEIETDLSAGKTCWAEDTGSYKGNCMRIGGGYNEWGDKYIATAPAGFKKLEYQITPHILIAEETAGTLSTEEYPVFIGIGASQDWSLGYAGPNGTPSGVKEAVNGVLKSGETTTVSVTFEKVADYTWWVAPCMIIDDPSTLAANTTFDVKVYLDGVEVATDLTVGKNFWAENTDTYVDNCVRIGGGYNEWGDKYIAESPKNYTTISFEITPEIYISEPVEEEAYVSAAGPVDTNGTYNAYIGFQTPKYSFRNTFFDASYGLAAEDGKYFNQVTGWDADNNAVTLEGTFTDVQIAGNGTYTVTAEGLNFPEGEFASQDYLNLIFLSTDIPNTNEVTISDVELKIDGKSVELSNAGAIVSPDSKDYLTILLQNVWNDDVKTIGYYAVPMNKISITFTVSGFAYDKAAEVKEETPVVTETSVSTETAASVAVTEPAVTATSSSSALPAIIIIIVAVCAIAAGVCITISKKKKSDK